MAFFHVAIEGGAACDGSRAVARPRPGAWGGDSGPRRAMSPRGGG
eukprot:CAMPEP_0184098896 /NCGR_PEP_ID=MMETSP0974-20121125/11544_1 /TAXON_ID=483370 /ORGANISM="non described non described, Strain CCMP2097" /LENGTH=44 /DNA_ID= /DNA_START= /DNA_END= /DNA_ORIENTATION=